jgi:hypothetical protein
VRQVECAAEKASSGGNKSALFERKLVALYTAATLDAAQHADKVGEEGSLAAHGRELEGSSGGTLSRYLLAVCGGGPPGSETELGLVAVG